MTPAQRNLLDAARHLLDVIAEPNEIAYELTIDNATNRLDDAIKAAEADDSDGWTPCGPDGPFPPKEGERVEVTVLDIHGDRFVDLDFRIDGQWSTWDSDRFCVVAWKLTPKPYDPKGQA